MKLFEKEKGPLGALNWGLYPDYSFKRRLARVSFWSFTGEFYSNLVSIEAKLTFYNTVGHEGSIRLAYLAFLALS